MMSQLCCGVFLKVLIDNSTLTCTHFLHLEGLEMILYLIIFYLTMLVWLGNLQL